MQTCEAMESMKLKTQDLKFDEDNHIYSIRGMRLPSVTQIMQPMSLMLYEGISAQTLSDAADRGTRAHEQISNAVVYGIVETDEDTEPYIQAFKDFSSMYNPQWIASEIRTYHKALRYAGTIDLLSYVSPDDGNGVDVIDLKTTAAWHPVMIATQTSAYAEALRSHGVKVRSIYGLQLRNNGKWRFEKLEDCFKTFLHSMGVFNAMQAELN